MSKENLDQLGLEEVAPVAEAAATTEKVAKVKKEQTPEEKSVLEAGVVQIVAMGVSANLAKVLALVPEWNGEKETLSAAKEAVIKEFGGSEELKNYIDGVFQEEVKAWQGIAKAIPVLNNIKSFYARREGTGASKKAKLIQISISGAIYNVDAAYAEEIKTLPVAERKELLLAHASTVKVEVAEELF